MFGLRKKKAPIEAPAEIAGVRVKASQRARRMALRVDAKIGDVVLTWPRGASEHGALRFIESNRDWIEQHRRKIPVAKHFSEGEVIPVYGRDFRIVRRDGRGVTTLTDDTLVVHSRPEHLERRIKNFLKETAEEVLSDIAAQKQDQLNLKSKPLRVIDPRTRWGSCSPDGRMMFSWRLILAPPHVLDYVVAHEVAHRVHMNHSRKFWALCASLTDDAGASRRWLKKNGSALMSYR